MTVVLVLVALFTAIQTLYLESMRLLPRDVRALPYFKDVLQERIGLEVDEGSLIFSLWKHSLLVIAGVLVLAEIVVDQAPFWIMVLQGVVGAWLMMMLFSYVIPQFLCRRTAGHWAAPLVPFYRVTALMMKPVSAVMKFLNRLLDIGKPEPEEQSEAEQAAENVEALITAGTEEGLIEEEDRQLIHSVVAFGDKIVREVMTARPDIVAVQADETLEKLRELVVKEQYSRIPVYEGSIDEISGFVHARDMFEVPERARLTRTVRELARPIRVVPDTKPVDDLFRDMQREGAHMVIVVDEYGHTAGLATLEDLVEVIVGEIRDEHEPGSDVTPDGAGGFIVAGSFELARVPELTDFHPSDEITSTTVGGLVMEWLGHVPKPGEVVERDGLRLEVLASGDLRVDQVRLSQAQPPAVQPEQTAA
jgi:CBS domain containing-hemolysin-like protein